MRNIATRYVHGVDVNRKHGDERPRLSLRARLAVVALGALSLTLYLLLFRYSDSLLALARAARAGEKLYAVAPIAIALVFSLAHGAFTAHFWDALGLRPRKR
jgi:peptidoglycan/LPS O-acetylase OafA/YrhL